MGGFRLRYTEEDANLCSKMLPFHFKNQDGTYEAVLPIDAFINLVDAGIIEVPKVSKAEIMDKSKKDALVKLNALLQLLWFTLQFLARIFKHLEATLIEVSTVALALTSIATYVLWLQKPMNVNCPFIVKTIPKPDDSARVGTNDFGTNSNGIQGNCL